MDAGGSSSEGGGGGSSSKGSASGKGKSLAIILQPGINQLLDGTPVKGLSEALQTSFDKTRVGRMTTAMTGMLQGVSELMQGNYSTADTTTLVNKAQSVLCKRFQESEVHFTQMQSIITSASGIVDNVKMTATSASMPVDVPVIEEEGDNNKEEIKQPEVSTRSVFEKLSQKQATTLTAELLPIGGKLLFLVVSDALFSGTKRTVMGVAERTDKWIYLVDLGAVQFNGPRKAVLSFAVERMQRIQTLPRAEQVDALKPLIADAGLIIFPVDRDNKHLHYYFGMGFVGDAEEEEDMDAPRKRKKPDRHSPVTTPVKHRGPRKAPTPSPAPVKPRAPTSKKVAEPPRMPVQAPVQAPEQEPERIQSRLPGIHAVRVKTEPAEPIAPVKRYRNDKK